ncbi:MAG: hypothetical protein ACFFC7_33425 [Candidatus Hermodarchaeota archaeon]
MEIKWKKRSLSVVRNLIFIGGMILLGVSMFLIFFNYLSISIFLRHGFLPPGWVSINEIGGQASNWILLGALSAFSGISGGLLVGYGLGQRIQSSKSITPQHLPE